MPKLLLRLLGLTHAESIAKGQKQREAEPKKLANSKSASGNPAGFPDYAKVGAFVDCPNGIQPNQLKNLQGA